MWLKGVELGKAKKKWNKTNFFLQLTINQVYS